MSVMEDKALRDTAEDIRVLAAIVSKMASLDRDRRLSSCGAGVSSLQFSVLQSLAVRPGTLSDLSREFGLEPATLVPVVDSLERKALLQRTKDPRDRRRSPLVISTAGFNILQNQPFVEAESALVHALSELGPIRVSALHQLLQDVSRVVARDIEGDQNVVDIILSGARSRREAIHAFAEGPAA